MYTAALRHKQLSSAAQSSAEGDRCPIAHVTGSAELTWPRHWAVTVRTLNTSKFVCHLKARVRCAARRRTDPIYTYVMPRIIGYNGQAAPRVVPPQICCRRAKSRRCKRQAGRPMAACHVASRARLRPREWAEPHQPHAERTAALWERGQLSLHTRLRPRRGSDDGSNMKTAPGSSGSTPIGDGTRCGGSSASVLLGAGLSLNGTGRCCCSALGWLYPCKHSKVLLSISWP
jgi:hypothetical protein